MFCVNCMDQLMKLVHMIMFTIPRHIDVGSLSFLQSIIQSTHNGVWLKEKWLDDLNERGSIGVSVLE